MVMAKQKLLIKSSDVSTEKSSDVVALEEEKEKEEDKNKNNKKRNLTVSKLLISSKLYIEYFDFLLIARRIFVLYSDK